MERKTVLLPDSEMDYIEFGNGNKAFVIIPGLSVHSVMGLADQIVTAYQDFAEEYKVYVFDRTKDLKEGCTIRNLAEDTAVAMKNVGIGQACVFGASQGGAIAQYLAIDHPKLVEKLVLGSTFSRPGKMTENSIRKWMRLAQEKKERELIEAFVDEVYSENTLKMYREIMISSNLGITDEEYQRFVILAGTCMTFDSYTKLSGIRCPVLVLGSEGDKVVGPEASREIADALGCELYLYDGSYGHGVYDEAEDYKRRCLDFFRK